MQIFAMFFQINCIHFGFMAFYFNQMYTIARKHYIQTTLKLACSAAIK